MGDWGTGGMDSCRMVGKGGWLGNGGREWMVVEW